MADIKEKSHQRDQVRVTTQPEYDGILFPEKGFDPTVIKLLPQMPTQPNDVLITGYPRSGTTWMGLALDLIITGGDIKRANSSTYGSRIYFLESAKGVIRAEQCSESFRQLKTHLPFRHVEALIKQKQVKTVVTMRNPKDMLVSFYHFYKSNSLIVGNYTGTWNDFFKLFRNKQLVYGDWLEHTMGYWMQRDLNNVLIIKYEDAKENLVQILKQLAHFLDKNLSDDELEDIANYISFNEMQKNPMTNGDILVKKGIFSQHIPFLRQGKVGGWRQFFTPEQSKFVDEAYIKPLQDVGLHLKCDSAMSQI